MDANCEASIRRYITFTDPDQVVVDYLADHNSTYIRPAVYISILVSSLNTRLNTID